MSPGVSCVTVCHVTVCHVSRCVMCHGVSCHDVLGHVTRCVNGHGVSCVPVNHVSVRITVPCVTVCHEYRSVMCHGVSCVTVCRVPCCVVCHGVLCSRLCHVSRCVVFQVVSPLLTQDAVDLLTNCLSSRETELWQSLDDPWVIPRELWKYPVPPYQPGHIHFLTRSKRSQMLLLCSNKESTRHSYKNRTVNFLTIFNFNEVLLG